MNIYQKFVALLSKKDYNEFEEFCNKSIDRMFSIGEDIMELATYLNLIHDRLTAYFDIEQPYEYLGTTYNLYAKSDLRSERYFASKKIKVYAIENKEHVFAKFDEAPSARTVEGFWEILYKASEELPDPHDEHMSTIINGVLITPQGVDVETQKIAEKLKHEKSFLLGLKGWVYIRLVIVDLASESLVHNKRGKEVRELYSPGKPVNL